MSTNMARKLDTNGPRPNSADDLSFEERLTQLIEAAGGVMKASALCGVSRTTLNSWGKGAKMPLEAALKLAEAAHVTLDWVATGFDRRPDVVDQNKPVADASDDGTAIAPTLAPEAQRAGQEVRWLGLGLAPIFSFNVADLREDGLDPGSIEYVRMEGLQMAPLLRDGDFAFIDRSKTRLRHNRVYAVLHDNKILIRRVRFGRNGSAILFADKCLESEEITDLTGVKILGRVFSTTAHGTFI